MASTIPLQRRPGFTLVELLVVTAIIGILIGLLVPAVQAAREAARRVDCSNRVHQIALALHEYVMAEGMFPPGAKLKPGYPSYGSWYDPWTEATSADPGMRGTSWMVEILPWIEQDNLFQKWDFTKSAGENELWAATDIPLFYCPSRRSTVRTGDQQIMFRGWSAGGTDYGACIGRNNGWRNDHAGCFGVGHKFLVSNTLFDAKKRGVFGPNVSVSFAHLRDGASSTIVIGEMQRLWPDPSLSGINNSSRTSNDGWALAGVATLFTTAICKEDDDLGQPGGMNNWFFESAGSDHPGGAWFAMADGSVRFLSEHIDAQVYAWMGSMADGKAMAVP